ncbi:MAG: lysostaphin resistance A-like protein [Pyrinomonadaceae bacterium]
MRAIFFDQRGRIRSGWRAATFLFSFLLLSFFAILSSITFISTFPMGESATSFIPLIVPFTISALIAILLGWLYGKLFEGLPFRALGISFSGGWLKNFAAGCLIGAVALSSAIVIAMMSGGLNLTANRESSGTAVATTLLTTLLIFAVGAASEESLFRGYLLQTFIRPKHFFIGIGLTSLLFAVAHNNNPDASRLSMLNTFLAGIWFATAYLKTRDLWFPLGIHLTWNWLQGPVFGINVSGITEFSPDPVLRATDLGPAWLTGGSYGIEGGIACTIALVISIGLIYFLPGIKPDPELFVLSENHKQEI